MDENDKTTDFGFQDVPFKEKTARVAQVFSSVAQRYDLMNDLMSFGLHRIWKKMALNKAQVRPGQCVLDLAGGTGDMTRLLAKQVGRQGRVILADINQDMLNIGRDRLIDAGLIDNVDYVVADAQALPFPKNQFDRIVMAFGLRNVTDKDQALRAMFRALKPGGKVIILEFSRPVSGLQTLYDCYSFNVIPVLGEWVTGDRDSYQYLVESIRKHPTADQLKAQMTDAAFEEVDYHRLAGGIVALHFAYKY